MSVNPNYHPSSPPVIEIKSSSVTLPLFKLLGNDLEKISNQLMEKVQLAPDFFLNAPVIIDLHELVEKKTALDFSGLISMLRGYGINPVGVRGGDETYNENAKSVDLVVLSDARAKQKPESVDRESPVNRENPREIRNSARIIDRPVRSGQKVYTAGADLIILSQVSHGAEIIADGNIHVYGTLRGRALAGVKGNVESRIFCQDFRAEIVSIGGHFKTSEHLDASLLGKPVQVYLQDESLIIEPI